MRRVKPAYDAVGLAHPERSVEDKIGQRVALARCLASLEMFGKLRPVAQFSDRRYRIDREAGRHRQHLPEPLAIEPGHAMGMPSAQAGLQRKTHPGRAGIEAVGWGRDFLA